MTSIQFLEIALSLTIQAGAVVCLTQGLTICTPSEQVRDRLWAAAFVVILVLTLAACTMPHLRLVFPTPPTDPLAIKRQAAWLTHVSQIVLGVWLTGAFFGFMQIAMDWRCVLQMLACSQVSTIVSTEDFLGDAEIRTHTRLMSPFCWQIHRPLIVVPCSVTELPPDEFYLILRHELEHLRRGHPLHLFLQRIAGLIYWYHPAVWWASAQADAEREFVCDTAAVSNPREAATFLRTMLRLAEESPSPPPSTLAGLPFGGTASLIVRRAEHLMQRVLTQSPLPAARPFLVTGLYTTAVLVAGLWWPLVSLSPEHGAWSPWPAWSAHLLHTVGISARDYEVDGHRLLPHELAE